MSTLLIKRAYRVLILSMATMLIAGLLAPIVAVANTDLVAGDTAIVNNPDGTGAYLRTDTTVLDDTTISAELPQGSTVWVMEAPVYNDTGAWVYVASDGFGPGWISISMLEKVTTETVDDSEASAEDPAADEAAEPEAPVSTLPWLEPVDSATVVDYNNELPVEGLAVRTSIDGDVLGHAPVTSQLDVTGEREWVGEKNYIRVNFNGAGGYVDGAFVELASEVPVEEPVEEVIWVDEETVPEAAPAEGEVVTDPAPEVVPAEEEVVTDPAPEVIPAEGETVTEPAPEVVPAEDEVVTAPEVIPAEEEVVTDPAPEVVPAEGEVVTDPAPEVVPAEGEVVTDPAPEVVPVEEEVITDPAPEVVPAEDEVVTDAAPAEDMSVVASPSVADTTVASPAVTEAPASTVATPAVTEAPASTVATPAVTEAPATANKTTPVTPTATVAPTATATKAPVTPTAVPTQAVTPAPIASTANTFDTKAMIGSATVTGTSSGLLCRTQPNPSAPVLMTLAEGTKVLVSAEAVNGYLGIDCGGLQGFADVNYLWSGGAGDGEIRSARMNVVVTGTGNGLNCRTGAGLSYPVITTVFDGTSLVTRGAASNGWTPVTCAGKNGFVSTTWIEPTAGSTSTARTTATAGSARVNTGGDGLYCRSGAGTSYGVITVLSHGSSVAVRGAAQGGWIPVTCGGKAGFAHGDYLSVTAGSSTPVKTPTAPSAGTATGSVTVANTGGQGLNCRSGAGTSNSIITTLALGQTVKTRSGSVSGWTAVICGGTNGFVSSEFVNGATASAPAPSAPKPTAPAPSGLVRGTNVKTTDAVNLRYSASMTSSVSTVISAGIVIQITGSLSNSYYPVNYDGLTGYVHQDYVVKTSAALSQRGGSGVTSPAPAPAPAPSTGSPTGSALVNYAMRYQGYPYVWATHGPASFDCSGFTYWVVLNVTGKNIGWGTWTQVSAGTPVSKANLQPGDLVFFQNTYTAGLSHVGLYIGNGQFIHAQNEETGVVISDLNSSYYGPRWYGGVRL